MNVRILPTILFSLFTIGVLLLAWFERDEFWYNAEDGIGYAFGIIGSTMMVLLLLYPARKYWKPMRHAFKVHHWFRLHMVFGVLGPCLILLHSNFNLGSLNSSIALFSMLLVAGSGLIGRYVYQKLHRGLYGEQIIFSDLDGDYQLAKSHFTSLTFITSDVQQSLDQIESKLILRSVPIRISYWAIRNIKSIRRKSKLSIKALTLKTKEDKNKSEETINNINYWNEGLSSLEKMANYALYTRLFSLWHVFHLPIFFMMIIAATVHIFVVHMY
ncbi:MAG: hypothetical protein QNK36_08920 [Colwellia sp.]|nr:hypothetical protein [Colwellia sp.]